jgi:tetratricopeptide (TPR) repeat protein
MHADTELADRKKVDQALEHLQNGDILDAESILLDVCSRCPDEYQYEETSDGNRFIKFWDRTEFLCYTFIHGEDPKNERVVWLYAAYPPACYYLAFVLIEKRDFAGAIRWLTKGQSMEPQNPKFLLELGMAYGGLKDHEKSLGCYQQALDLATKAKLNPAVALRGMGVQLIELHRLDEAELRLRESLELEPANDIAKRELMYISQLRNGQQPEEVETRRTL